MKINSLFNLNSIVVPIISSCILCILTWLCTLSFPQPQTVEMSECISYMLLVSLLPMLVWGLTIIIDIITFVYLKLKTNEWPWDYNEINIAFNYFSYGILIIVWIFVQACLGMVCVSYLSQSSITISDLLFQLFHEIFFGLNIYNIFPLIIIILWIIHSYLWLVNYMQTEEKN